MGFLSPIARKVIPTGRHAAVACWQSSAPLQPASGGSRSSGARGRPAPAQPAVPPVLDRSCPGGAHRGLREFDHLRREGLVPGVPPIDLSRLATDMSSSWPEVAVLLLCHWSTKGGAPTMRPWPLSQTPIAAPLSPCDRRGSVLPQIS